MLRPFVNLAPDNVKRQLQLLQFCGNEDSIKGSKHYLQILTSHVCQNSQYLDACAISRKQENQSNGDVKLNYTDHTPQTFAIRLLSKSKTVLYVIVLGSDGSAFGAI